LGRISKISSHFLAACATDSRRVVGAWRFEVLCRRRRFVEEFGVVTESNRVSLIRQMLRQGQLSPIEGVRGVYLIDVDFAKAVPYTDELIIQEALPLGVFSHLSAIAFHALTDVPPPRMYATVFRPPTRQRLPLGTFAEDWVDEEIPAGSQPQHVRNVDVEWTATRSLWEFGITIGHSAGLPIYVTDVPRTLLDTLRAPEKCGGFISILRAWKQVTGSLDVDALMTYAERFESPLLRQRVGFILEELGVEHPRLNEWRTSLGRGGSMKLVADQPYSPTFSERWNLSINLPATLLDELRDSP
jgi:predicted transcriptional regulator of viral defense system